MEIGALDFLVLSTVLPVYLPVHMGTTELSRLEVSGLLDTDLHSRLSTQAKYSGNYTGILTSHALYGRELSLFTFMYRWFYVCECGHHSMPGEQPVRVAFLPCGFWGSSTFTR